MNVLLHQKYERSARAFFNLGTITTIGFIRSNYGDEAVKKLFAALAKPLTEQLKKTPGEGALKALNFARASFQIVGNDIRVLEESPRKVVFQATACGPSKVGVGGPGTPLCEFCAASIL